MPKNRIEAFSDGVIAIIITLLVLEIKIPHIHMTSDEHLLIQAIFNDSPKFIAYAVSFIVLTVWWVAHHQFFHGLHKANRSLIWLNNLFLFWLCLLPYPTALIGTYPSTRTSTFLYGLIATSVAATFTFMRWYASFKAELIHGHIPKEVQRDALRKSIRSPILHGIATILAIATPYVSIVIYALLAIYFAFPMKLDKHLWEDNKSL